jgi:2-oxo-4-hydroxy-4-carboxy-5-ureidoimidazoline decarboxylase
MADEPTGRERPAPRAHGGRAAPSWLNPPVAAMSSADAPDREAFVARYGGVFEHSPWVAEGAWERRPFAGLDDLHAAMCAAMYAAPRERQLALVRAHPDLAGKAAIAGGLTDDSRREQASAGLDRLTPAEHAAFTRHNEAYRERFGFPFVICAREHTKESILAAMQARLAHDPGDELATALAEIAKIARLRLEAMA